MSLQAVYGYSLDTKRYSKQVVCNSLNLSCLQLRSDCSSLVILCCIICVKHIVETSELGIQRRKEARRVLKPAKDRAGQKHPYFPTQLIALRFLWVVGNKSVYNS